MLWQPPLPSEQLYTPPPPWGFAQVNGVWVPESSQPETVFNYSTCAAPRDWSVEEITALATIILFRLPPDLRRWELAKSLAEAEASFNERLDAIADRHRMRRPAFP